MIQAGKLVVGHIERYDQHPDMLTFDILYECKWPSHPSETAIGVSACWVRFFPWLSWESHHCS